MPATELRGEQLQTMQTDRHHSPPEYQTACACRPSFPPLSFRSAYSITRLLPRQIDLLLRPLSSIFPFISASKSPVITIHQATFPLCLKLHSTSTMSASPAASGAADVKPADQIHFRFCREW